MAAKMINLGCGDQTKQGWENYDYHPTSRDVRPIDLRKPLPFEDDSVDVVYSSHVVEHLTRTEGARFINECYRILKRTGLIRLATPDLETIAREYLLNLEGALNGNQNAEHAYDWITLELYDQAARGEPGGDMLKFFARGDIPNWPYVRSRCGSEAERLREAGRRIADTETGNPKVDRARKWRKALRAARAHLRANPKERRERLLRGMLGPEYELLELGRFRQSGEIIFGSTTGSA